MPIQPLSKETSNVLISSLVLNNATSVIKELLDNAIDSSATSVIIEIASNTLDIIQVRDNGSGIGIEDRQLLCKRGCTSKIRNLDDLEHLGGRYLGFRGEALASIAELSDCVSITTRISDEVVGTVLRFGSDGKMKSSASASHPIGTTVRVQNLMHRVPVRKQAVLKEATKILADIKNLLLHYAFARPTIKISFKVLKGKNEKANWASVPCDGSEDLMTASVKIIGKEVAVQCSQYTRSEESDEGGTYRINALLLNCGVGPDPMGMIESRQYVAVDGRPLISNRGSIAECLKLYKRYLRNANVQDIKLPQKPFIVLQIFCPRGSYDINVEPAKDDVLFHNKDKMIGIVEQLFEEVYGRLDTNGHAPETKKRNRTLKDMSTLAFDVLLASKPSSVPGNATSLTGDCSAPDLPPLNREHINPSQTLVESDLTERERYPVSAPTSDQSLTTFRSMYDVDEEIADAADENIRGGRTIQEDKDEGIAASIHRNPFSMAAMHARVVPHARSFRQTDLVERESGPSTVPGIRSPSLLGRHASEPSRTPNHVSRLLTPDQSPSMGKPHQKSSLPNAEGIGLGRGESRPHAPAQRVHLQSDFQSRESNLRASEVEIAQFFGRGPDGSIETSPPAFENVSSNVSTQDSSPLGIRLSLQQKPFKSPSRMLSPEQSSHPSASVPSYGLQQSLIVPSELDQIMDFELRKKAINQKPKGYEIANPAELAHMQKAAMEGLTPNQKFTTIHDDSEIQDETIKRSINGRDQHQTYISSGMSLRTGDAVHAVSNPRDQITSSMPFPSNGNLAFAMANQNVRVTDPIQKDRWQGISDSRAYLISARTAGETNLNVKLKTSRLPFEVIPKDSIKHDIMCVPSTPFPQSDSLLLQSKQLAEYDEYIKTGHVDPVSWSPFSRQVGVWETRTKNIIKHAFRTGFETGHSESVVQSTASIQEQTTPTDQLPDFNISLIKAIKGHLQMLSEQEIP